LAIFINKIDIMTFVTKIDLSSNRQAIQNIKTITDYSGTSIIGTTFSDLPSGPDLTSSGITSTIFPVESTFTATTTGSPTMVITYGNPYMSALGSEFTAITSGNSGTTQWVGPVFSADSTTVIDGNPVDLSFTGVSSSFLVWDTLIVGTNIYGSATSEVILYSADTLDYTGSTEWLQVKGGTGTEKLRVSEGAVAGYTLVAVNSDGDLEYQPYSGVSELWEVSTGLFSLKPKGYIAVASGDYALAGGGASTASGNSSFAWGSMAQASGIDSVAFGSGSATGYQSFALAGGIASGVGSIAFAGNTSATGDNSGVGGSQTVASGNYSFVWGTSSNAFGQSSVAMGASVQAYGAGSHAEGTNTLASGDSSHSEGNSTRALGLQSHAEGSGSKSFGASSHAEGFQTSASGDSSHAEGRSTKANGIDAHAEGRTTIAGGDVSHAEGIGSVSSGDYSHAEGSTVASGFISHSEGNNTTAFGDYSHAGGHTSIASGETSFVHANTSIAGGVNSAILGGTGNTLTDTAINSVMLGGSGMTGTAANTVYVPELNVDVVPAGPATSVGVDGTGSLAFEASDRTLKENITTIESALDKVRKLRGVTFDWINKEKGGTDTEMGFIAQEVQGIVPELAFQIPNSTLLGVKYNHTVALLVEAIKEITSGTTTQVDTIVETQRVVAEDSNIELNYHGTKESSIDGGIIVKNGVSEGVDAKFTIDSDGTWNVTPKLKTPQIVIESKTPISSEDSFGEKGQFTWDDDYLYVKTNNGWKRTGLENF
tara:strand:- start:17755 stop:20058 length:2304 start_codon:yes stop_codon:yes gene_type:complete